MRELSAIALAAASCIRTDKFITVAAVSALTIKKEEMGYSRCM